MTRSFFLLSAITMFTIIILSVFYSIVCSMISIISVNWHSLLSGWSFIFVIIFLTVLAIAFSPFVVKIILVPLFSLRKKGQEVEDTEGNVIERIMSRFRSSLNDDTTENIDRLLDMTRNFILIIGALVTFASFAKSPSLKKIWSQKQVDIEVIMDLTWGELPVSKSIPVRFIFGRKVVKEGKYSIIDKEYRLRNVYPENEIYSFEVSDNIDTIQLMIPNKEIYYLSNFEKTNKKIAPT